MKKIDRCGVASGRQFLAARQRAEVRKCLQITYASLLQNLQILSGLL